MVQPIPVAPEQSPIVDADDQEPVDLVTEISEFLPAWMTSLVSHLCMFLLLALITAAGNGFGSGVGISIESLPGGSDGVDGDGSGPTDNLPDGDLSGTDAKLDAQTPPTELANLTTAPLEDVPKFELAGIAGLSGDIPGGLTPGNGHGEGSGVGDNQGDGEGDGGGSGFGLNPTKTAVFGLAAEGTRFVYVFDRSESMTARLSYTSEGATVYSIMALDAAKAELLRSLDDLDPRQQFQIVFYNHEPHVLNPARGTNKLMAATKDAKRRAAAFAARIYGEGGTRHIEPLEIAINMKPDVIFLLTDGEAKDDPTHFQLEQLAKMNKGRAKINVIQFCYAPRPDGTLKDLAAQNGGQYVVFNISHLGPGLPGGPRGAGAPSPLPMAEKPAAVSPLP